MSFTASTRDVSGVAVIDLAGKLVLGEPTGQLREVVRAEAEKANRILLNMTGLTYIDSAGLGELVSAKATMNKRGGEIKLSGLQPKVIDLLQVTRLHTLFEVFDDEQKALASFRQTAGV